jgi:hypothetical protein
VSPRDRGYVGDETARDGLPYLTQESA